jgi:phospholipase C
MSRRIGHICVSLVSSLLTVTFIGCGYSIANINPSETVNSEVTDVAPKGDIQHVVVIFQENVSFDHYFGTYPNALNLPGELPFTAFPLTPAVDGLSPSLLLNNPNAGNRLNGAGAANPFRLSPAEAATADQDHSYKAEQMAFDAGAMDLFPRSVGAADSPNLGSGIAATTGLTMGYYDGNTVTALWNYAQRYAMSDRFFGTTFGPSTVGAINLISGQTNGVVNDANAEGVMV